MHTKNIKRETQRQKDVKIPNVCVINIYVSGYICGINELGFSFWKCVEK